MYNGTIENSIIAYFDGRLSDAESADLLHRASVSPEIRQIFRAHESMRKMVSSALTSVSVRPEIEDALFAKIQALAAAEAVPAAIPMVTRSSTMRRFFRRRAALLTLLFLAAAGLFAYNLSDKGISGVGKLPASAQSSIPKTFADPNSDNTATELGPSEASNKTENSLAGESKGRLLDYTQTSNARLSRIAVDSKRGPIILQGQPDQQNEVEKNSGPQTNTEILPISAMSPSLPQLQIGGPDRHATTIAALQPSLLSMAAGRNFEIVLESSTGFIYPASSSTIAPFSDIRAALSYALTPNNLIGLRFTSGLFEVQGAVSQKNVMGMPVISRGLERNRALAQEIVYTHREFLPLQQLVLVDASLSAGLIPHGNTLGIELGVKLPLYGNVMMGFSFGLTRVHNAVQSGAQLVSGSDLGSAPVLYDVSDIRNTLNGRLQYGLSLQF